VIIQLFERKKQALNSSQFRSSFALTEKDRQYVEKKSIQTIERHARDFIATRLAPAYPRDDGKQTPFRGHPVFKAQHATATCCRGCLEKWYLIQKGTQLTNEQQDEIIFVLMFWIQEKLSNKESKNETQSNQRFDVPISVTRNREINAYGFGTKSNATKTPTISPPTPMTAGTTILESNPKPETSFNVTYGV